MGIRSAYRLVKTALMNFIEDDVLTLAGALAFYTSFSLAPLVVMFVAFTALLGEPAQQQLLDQIGGVIGPQGREALEMLMERAEAENQDAGILATVLGIGTILVSATVVFAQLQYTMNRVWNIRPRPGSGLWNLIRKRILSLGMILAIGFLMMVSLGISTALTIGFGEREGAAWQVAHQAASLLVFGGLFALMFKVLPDARIGWRSIWFGAAVTAVLFEVGKFAIGKYLGLSGVGSAYGAAGSLVILLIWVYYASLIVFFGAELTQAFARQAGQAVEPNRHAMWADEAQQQMERQGESDHQAKKQQLKRAADRSGPAEG